jgi:hypothetical protein
MEMWETVAIVADAADFEFAVAIRGVLELYRLRAHMVYCPTEETMRRALGGDLPPSDHVIICGFTPESPAAVSDTVRLGNRLVLMLRHPGAFDEMAEAWLTSGCRGIVRPAEDVDQNACVMFVLAFYYHLLGHALPEHGRALTEREAFERAREFDIGREGTRAFRMLDREDLQQPGRAGAIRE